MSSFSQREKIILRVLTQKNLTNLSVLVGTRLVTLNPLPCESNYLDPVYMCGSRTLLADRMDLLPYDKSLLSSSDLSGFLV